jgi:hypothetical protein
MTRALRRESVVAPVAAAHPHLAQQGIVQRISAALDDMADDANRRGEQLDLATLAVAVNRQRATGALRVFVTCEPARHHEPDPGWTPTAAADAVPLIDETERRDLA